MVRSLLKRAAGERGAALIETALTLPLLLFVSISIMEFGRAYQHWQVLTNAAREGARIAVLPCGHYSTGAPPFKFIDGYYLGNFLARNL